MISDKEIKEVCLKDKCWSVEIAQDKAKGLMDRESLDGGMLFVYNEEKIIPIWMKNMKIPLDIIWLNKDREVVHIIENAQPCGQECESFKPDVEAMYVLELNAGEIKENKIEIGDVFWYDDII